MVWLTWKAFELERDEAYARAQAELEVELGNALWQIDSKLLPLLAREAARPYTVYTPVHTVGTGDKKQKIASPLLNNDDDHVVLHFQCSDAWCSPQAPLEEDMTLAIRNGLTPQQVFSNTSRLKELEGVTSQKSLWNMLPEANRPVLANNLPAETTNANQLDDQTPAPYANAEWENGSGYQIAPNQAAVPNDISQNLYNGAYDDIELQQKVLDVTPSDALADSARENVFQAEPKQSKPKFNYGYGGSRNATQRKLRSNQHLKSRLDAVRGINARTGSSTATSSDQLQSSSSDR